MFNKDDLFKFPKLNVAISALAGEGGSGDGGSGDGGSGGGDITETQAFKDALAAAVESEVDGLKAKNSDLIKKNSEASKQLAKFEGIDVDRFKKMMEHVDNSEEAKLISEGKMDEVIQRRTDKIQSQFTDQIAELTTGSEALATENNVLKGEIQDMVVGNELRSAAIKAGVLPEAVDDILIRGRGIFSVDENKEIVARNAAGELVKIGDKLLTPERFVDSLKTSNPYYWGQSQGAGGRGNNGGRGHPSDELASLTSVATGGNFDLAAYRKAKGTDKK